MARRVSDLLAQRATESFVGRSGDLASLLKCLRDDRPLVVQVHGLAGVGKTTLLDAFSSHARAEGAVVVRLDCRTTEPTERGFLYELGVAIGSQNSKLTADEAAERLGAWEAALCWYWTPTSCCVSWTRGCGRCSSPCWATMCASFSAGVISLYPRGWQRRSGRACSEAYRWGRWPTTRRWSCLNALASAEWRDGASTASCGPPAGAETGGLCHC
jgi:hypothetical protein